MEGNTVATRQKGREKTVLLVTTRILRPYKANEIIGVPESIARKLLNVNMQDEFGQVFTPGVRLYSEIGDEHLQLVNHTLNQEEADKLLRRLHPEMADDDEDEDEDEVVVSTPDSDAAPTEFQQIIGAKTEPAKRGPGRPPKNA
jgi:hypothetical protein